MELYNCPGPAVPAPGSSSRCPGDGSPATGISHDHAALAGGGYLLNATGFDESLGGAQTTRTITLLRMCDAGIPMVASAIAIWAVARFPITEARAAEVRQELEARRGEAGPVDPA